MTLQEIQYKAQGIIHKWRDDDSAPYIEFVEELAHMTVSEPSEGVVEAAEEYSRERAGGHILYDWVHAFIAGAKWQADHTPLPEDTVLFNKGVEEGKRLMMEEFEGNRLAACDNQTKEEYERETDFAESIIEKEHRQPTFSDAINYGMRLQKEQMMKEAVERNISVRGYKGAEGKGFVYESGGIKFIIVKED